MTSTLRAGLKRHKLVVETFTESTNSFGEVVSTPSTFVTLWGSIRPLRGREEFEARHFHAEATHVIRTRYVSGITPKMRIKFGSRLFDIESVVNVDELNRELEILATETV